MTLTAALNVILSIGVAAMVVTPLVWAILTQHRDHARPAATDGTARSRRSSHERARARGRRAQPLVGRS